LGIFMKFQKLITLLSLCLVFSAYGQTENKPEVRKLTIDDAVILAADNNVSLKRQRISLEQLEKKNKTSWNSISPSVRASGSYSLPLENTDAYVISGSLTASLTFTPSLFTAIKNAKLNYENGQISYELAVRQIELNVRKTFYSLILAKEQIQLAERNLESSRLRYNSNLDKYNRGQLSEIDLLSSQYAYEKLKPTLESTKITYENSIALFKQTLGLNQSIQLELDGSLNDFLDSKEISINYSVEDIPSVKTIKNNIELSKNSLLSTKFSAYAPSISATYNYGANNSLLLDGSRDWTVPSIHALSLSLSIPLDGYLPWSTGALSIDSQKASIKDLELQLENQKITSTLEIQNSLKQINQAKLQLSSLQDNVELAQKAFNVTQTAYEHGSKDFLSLQSASDDLFTARLSLQSQINTLVSSILDLEYTLGIPYGSLGE